MPTEVILIAATTIDGFIARHSLEVTSWSEDLHLFKEQTMGHPIIMGANTFKTLSNELVGREMIVVSRSQEPQDVLANISSARCFVVGGGKTYYRFIDHITDIYITPHPYVFGKGVPLFDGKISKEPILEFKNIIEVDSGRGIFQYQYEVIRK